MKKLIIALLVTAIGIVAVFGQTSFKEESVTDVKVQGNKVYFYKETVADSVMCTNTGSKCVIGRTTTLNAEIFEMTPRIEKISKKISTQQWLVMYQTGFFPETSITRGYCTSNGPYATAEIRDSIEKPKSKNGLFLSFENFRYKEPFLNKKTSKITEIEERKDYLLFVNRTLLGIIFLDIEKIPRILENQIILVVDCFFKYLPLLLLFGDFLKQKIISFGIQKQQHCYLLPAG